MCKDASDNTQETTGTASLSSDSLGLDVSKHPETTLVYPSPSDSLSSRVIPAEVHPVEVHPVEFLPVEVVPVTLMPSEVRPVETTVAPKSFSMPPDIGHNLRSRREEKKHAADKPQTPRKKNKNVRQWQLLLTMRRLKDTHRILFRITIAIVIVVAALVGLYQLFAPFTVSDQAMEDTIMQNESIMVIKSAYWFDSPQYGDIVVYKTPTYHGDGSEKPTVGRIIGLPGDRISIWDGSVYRNGQKLEEPYVKRGFTTTRLNEIVVLEGTYFILGDNRDASRDSRHRDVGLISRSQIVGKVSLKVSS